MVVILLIMHNFGIKNKLFSAKNSSLKFLLHRVHFIFLSDWVTSDPIAPESRHRLTRHKHVHMGLVHWRIGLPRSVEEVR